MNKIMNVKKGSIKKGLVLGALLLLASCLPVESPFGGERANTFADTDRTAVCSFRPTEGISFLSAAEQDAFNEMNYARTCPSVYARKVLQPFMDRCGNSSSAYCVTYVKTAIDTMSKMEPVEPLQPSLGLTLATRDFIADPGRDTHSSSSANFGSFSARAEQYGVPGIGRTGEIAWPTTVAGANQYDTVVSGWIIDNGVVGFGHRKILLGKKYRHVGIGFGYGASNAQTAGYKNKPAAYATLSSGIYTDKEQVAGQTLSKTSIAPVVTWPVLRFIDDKYKLYNAVAPAVNGKIVAAPQGGTVLSGWDS